MRFSEAYRSSELEWLEKYRRMMFDAGSRPPYWKIGCGPYFRRINSCIYLPTANRDHPRVETHFRVRCYRTPGSYERPLPFPASQAVPKLLQAAA